MKEIHAYQNDDGTYRVEILGQVKTSRLQHGKGWIDETTQSTAEIPRAQISITGLPSNDEGEGKYFTIMLGDEDTK